jgi:hypothetical protein
MGPRSRGAMHPKFGTNLVPLMIEGAGKAGCPLHPQPVCNVVSTRSSPQVHRNTRPSLRNGFNGFLRALPGDEFLFVTVVRRLRFCRARSGRRYLRGLDISNGCQDHTTSPYAATSPNTSTDHVPLAEVLAKALKRRSSARGSIAHGKPALRLPSRPTLPRPPHPIPRS